MFQLIVDNSLGFAVPVGKNVGVVEHVVAQVAGLGHVLEDLREGGHVGVECGDGLGRVDPVVVLSAFAEAANLFVLLVVLEAKNRNIKFTFYTDCT